MDGFDAQQQGLFRVEEEGGFTYVRLVDNWQEIRAELQANHAWTEEMESWVDLIQSARITEIVPVAVLGHGLHGGIYRVTVGGETMTMPLGEIRAGDAPAIPGGGHVGGVSGPAEEDVARARAAGDPSVGRDPSTRAGSGHPTIGRIFVPVIPRAYRDADLAGDLVGMVRRAGVRARSASDLQHEARRHMRRAIPGEHGPGGPVLHTPDELADGDTTDGRDRVLHGQLLRRLQREEQLSVE